jgi:hypothetical protein
VTDLNAFIAGLPKAELHVHHVGSASPRAVAELAARYEGSTPVPADPDLLAEYFTFTDFAHFITVYLTVVDLIRDAADVSMLTYDVARSLAGQQVRYAELTLTPYTSIMRGIPAEEFVDARRRASPERNSLPRWPGARHPWRRRGPGSVPPRRGDPDVWAVRRKAFLATSSLHISSRPAPLGCTAFPTRGSRPARSRSGPP